MKKLIISILVLLVFGITGCEDEDKNERELSKKDGVFVHISSGTDDEHRVLMGLQMAEKMSEYKDVLVYFDIQGIEVVLKETDDLTYSHFPSSKTQLGKLMAKGVPLMACPGCLKAMEKSEDDLINGVQIADKDLFFNFTKGRILTIDY